MACVNAIVIAFKCSLVGLPNSKQAVALMLGAFEHLRAVNGLALIALERFDATTVTSLSAMMLREKLRGGSKEST